MRLKIGEFNTLTIERITPQGFYLNSGVQEVLLPNRYITPEMKEGDEIEVFVLMDSEDRPVATTEHPMGILGSIVALEVVGTAPFGSFLHWGLDKDLMVPKALQRKPMQEGETHVVRIELDSVTDRLIGNPRFDQHLNRETAHLRPNQEVALLVYDRTPLGFSCLVDGQYGGMLYHNELFRPIEVGSAHTGYIRQVREDGKLDLSLRKQGFDGLEGQELAILNQLEAAKGFLPYNDNSSPEDIRRVFQMSKKSFKKLIGVLYKKQLIEITHKGIELSDRRR